MSATSVTVRVNTQPPSVSLGPPAAPTPPPTTLSGSKAIDGARGGSLSVGDWKVVVPKGAYVGSATISITVPNTSLKECDLGISPASLNSFKVPVDLWCKFPNNTEAQASSMFWWDPVAQVWQTIPSACVQPSRHSYLSHFSKYRGGRAGW